MKKLYKNRITLFLIILFLVNNSFSQMLTPNKITLIKDGKEKTYERKNWALQFNIGYTKFIYDQKTTDWLGDHNGFVFDLSFEWRRFYFLTGFRIFTVNPNKELYFGNNLLNNQAKLNPIKTDFELGYKYDLFEKVTLNGNISLLKSSFAVINEKQIGQNYNIPSIWGYSVGTSINYYFKMAPYIYAVLYLKYSFSISNYSQINSSLGNYFNAIEFGGAYKLWFRKSFSSDDAYFEN